MSTLAEIEAAVAALSRYRLQKWRLWSVGFMKSIWRAAKNARFSRAMTL